MQVDVSKSCQETDLVDLEVPTDENFVAASWAASGRAQEIRCVCSTYVYLSGWGTHGNCVVGSCAFSVGRLGFKRVNLVLGVVCCVCVSRNLEEVEISNSFIAVFRISRCLFRCSILTEIGYKTSFHLLLLWRFEENLISRFYEGTFRSWNLLLSSHTIFLNEIVSNFYL